MTQVVLISADKIVPNPYQPRKTLDAKELTSLAESIRVNGLLQPISLRKVGEGYEIVAGERRYRACVLAGVRKIPSIILNVTDEQSAVFALLENLQRQDLSFFEEAEGYLSLIQILGITQEKLAEKLGKSQSAVANKLRLLKLSDGERKLILEGGLTERHARAVLKIPDEMMRRRAINYIVLKGLNVSESEEYIETLLLEMPEKSKGKRVFLLKDIRLFINTVNKAVDFMKKSGIDVTAQQKDVGDDIEYYIKIPKNKRLSLTPNKNKSD
ncbi:MAG: ParB/RepB/Spo0J family partition protein [Oscillospiraceae bacterium]|nr:ParB/RepB/Spo0J family partition protein [Oscillospiraceae bacterium]